LIPRVRKFSFKLYVNPTSLHLHLLPLLLAKTRTTIGAVEWQQQQEQHCSSKNMWQQQEYRERERTEGV